ncbi:MAG: TPM domain-containing protein [Candidatus Peribacteria bacterium]|nr:TPM domain-containing protein [Candidatus Peribacteria bacterium]
MLLLILTTLLLSATKVYTIVEPTNEFYINDYANILNNETESYIIEKSQELELQTKAQIVVVTINSLE